MRVPLTPLALQRAELWGLALAIESLSPEEYQERLHTMAVQSRAQLEAEWPDALPHEVDDLLARFINVALRHRERILIRRLDRIYSA